MTLPMTASTQYVPLPCRRMEVIVAGMLGGEGDEGLTDFFHNVEVVVFVPGTPVGQHGFLDSL